VVENLIKKLFKNMLKIVEKYFNKKENLLKLKSFNLKLKMLKNNKKRKAQVHQLKVKYQNGKNKVKNLEKRSEITLKQINKLKPIKSIKLLLKMIEFNVEDVEENSMKKQHKNIFQIA
jgi:hypothetical protein